MADLPKDHRCAWRDEAERLAVRVTELECKLTELEAKAAQVVELEGKLAAVMTAMEALERRVLGPRSEKMPPPESELRKAAQERAQGGRRGAAAGCTRAATRARRVVTHTAKGDIVSGYTRASWPALCAEVGKLKVGLLDGKLLELCYDFATREKKLRNRWKKLWALQGLNLRLIPCEGITLPLS